jgi:hypothetical protein
VVVVVVVVVVVGEVLVVVGVVVGVVVVGGGQAMMRNEVLERLPKIRSGPHEFSLHLSPPPQTIARPRVPDPHVVVQGVHEDHVYWQFLPFPWQGNGCQA